MSLDAMNAWLIAGLATREGILLMLMGVATIVIPFWIGNAE